MLGKGLNFATAHSKNDVINFVASVEYSIQNNRDLNEHEKEKLRLGVVTSV